MRTYAPLVYAVTLIGLFLVITPLGSTVNGAHSWILLGGGFAFQPSEFAKLGLVLMLAMLLAQPARGHRPAARLDVVVALVVAAVTMGLVMLQPDLGTTMVLGVITARHARRGGGAQAAGSPGSPSVVVGAGVAVWFLGVLQPYQIARFTAFLNPASDPRGVGYNSTQSLIAIGSGELFGKGLFGGGADHRPVRARAAHRLHLHRGGGGVRLSRLGHRGGAARGDPAAGGCGSRASATTGSARWWPGRSCAGWPSSRSSTSG